MNHSNKYSFLFSFFLFFISCNNPSLEKTNITPAFYHWQTNLDLSELETAYLKNLNIQKIYPKFFDVDWDFNQGEPTALASIKLTTKLPENVEIVPTLFITNRTFVEIEASKIDYLVERIVQKLEGQMSHFDQQIIQEIQIDCDWTESTKDRYFLLLEKLKTAFQGKGIFLSATIRLHQIKYAQKTGIPPVQRGMLMYYNMGKVQDPTTVNSILDNEIGQQYLENLANYPLPLDMALPLFQWGVLFREGGLVKLMNQLEDKELVDSERFIKLTKNTWEVRKSTYLNGYYLYEKDEIRLEKVAIESLIAATQLLKKQAKMEGRTVVFYHLEEAVIQQFDWQVLEKILAVWE